MLEMVDTATGTTRADPPLFIAMSRFVVANGMEESVRQAFADRPRLVDGARGFVRMSVLRPAGRPEEFWLMTWWKDEPSYRAWHASHEYHESHRGIPKGLKLLRGSVEISFLSEVTD